MKTQNQEINLNVEVEIVCKNHGSFAQKPCDHLDGFGCPTCDKYNGKDVRGWMIKSVCIECKEQKIKELTSEFYKKGVEFNETFESALVFGVLEHKGILAKGESLIACGAIAIKNEMHDILEQLAKLGASPFK